MTEPTLDLVPSPAAGKPDASKRRTRLREFQAQLVERMHAAASGTAVQANQLGVMIGQSRCLLNLQEAGEIVSVGAITAVPLTKEWFLGLMNIRGNLVSIVDFAHFRGMPPTPVNKESRIIAFSPALSFNGGFLVSRVMGLRNVAEMEKQDSAAEEDMPWAAQRYVDRESQVWTELNLSLIVQDPRFLQVGL